MDETIVKLRNFLVLFTSWSLLTSLEARETSVPRQESSLLSQQIEELLYPLTYKSTPNNSIREPIQLPKRGPSRPFSLPNYSVGSQELYRVQLRNEAKEIEADLYVWLRVVAKTEKKLELALRFEKGSFFLLHEEGNKHHLYFHSDGEAQFFELYQEVKREKPLTVKKETFSPYHESILSVSEEVARFFHKALGKTFYDYSASYRDLRISKNDFTIQLKQKIDSTFMTEYFRQSRSDPFELFYVLELQESQTGREMDYRLENWSLEDIPPIMGEEHRSEESERQEEVELPKEELLPVEVEEEVELPKEELLPVEVEKEGEDLP